jgi:uncharacterized protein (UPF0276 family)
MSIGFGVGLRTPHYREFLENKPTVDWLEVHSENYFGDGGWDVHVLMTLRETYPISLHGVGLGLGSANGISSAHLAKIKALADRVQPELVSEHLCWGNVSGRVLNDLLPLPYTEEALAVIAAHVRQMQDVLGRQVLIENLSSYVQFASSTLSEVAFLNELVAQTGCGLLLDVNNVYVNQCNHGISALDTIHALNLDAVKEIHLAGHCVLDDVVIDHHGDVVADEVWDLYRSVVARMGLVSTLIEWDTDVPDLSVLLAQSDKARDVAHQASQVLV